MKKIYLFLFLCFLGKTAALDFDVKNAPEVLSPNSVMMIYEAKPFYFYRNLIEIKLDGITNNEILSSKSKDFIMVKIPDNIPEGTHSLDLYLDDNAHAQVMFNVIKGIGREDTTSNVNGYDPDPNTQNGEPSNLGEEPNGITRGGNITNPSGGYFAGDKIDCIQLHKIDGMFTDSVHNNIKEWLGIIPVSGRFSNFYMDYCSKSGVLYIMNDWILGKKNTDSTTCYNNFQFATASGAENWEIHVYNALSKKIKVIRNGIDVSEDTNYVLSGAYGFNPSLLEDSSHAMWEFGIKVKGGLFYSSSICDPSYPLPNTDPSVTTICNEETGYGLVTEPVRVVGTLDEKGTNLYSGGRYIPIGNVIGGLVIEPNSFSGYFGIDSSSIRTAGSTEFTIKCTGNHLIDGEFTNNEDIKEEWLDKVPAIGMYSNLYADYCDSILYILNDWTLGSLEPDERSCYNLFELFSGGGSEHWGIYVYHDINKGIRVFRNGVDVSKDSLIVLGGKFGFASSPKMEESHTIYEFGIKCNPGPWSLFLADPGPSTFCDGDFSTEARQINHTIGMRKIIDEEIGLPGETHSLIYSFKNDTITLICGTGYKTDELFSRRFRITFPIDTNDIDIIGIEKVDNFYLNDKSSNDIFNYYLKDNKIIIEGSSESNYFNIGDFCKIKVVTKFNNTDIVNLTPTIEFGNRTSYLRKTNITPLSINKKINGIAGREIESISIYPNPIELNDFINIRIKSEAQINIQFSLIDISGKTIYTNNEIIQAGLNILKIPTSNMFVGAYFVKLTNENNNIVIPVRIQ